FLEAALTGVAGIEDQIASLEGFSLCHGDLCATNILWAGTDAASSDPRVQYIDFEWAQGDDPARDLAIIGGRVHGGPWYVPLAEEQVAQFVDAYVRARGELGEVPAAVADAAALRERMRAWTAYERTAMLVHVASRAATRASHRRVLPVRRGTLAEAPGPGPCGPYGPGHGPDPGPVACRTTRRVAPPAPTLRTVGPWKTS